MVIFLDLGTGFGEYGKPRFTVTGSAVHIFERGDFTLSVSVSARLEGCLPDTRTRPYLHAQIHDCFSPSSFHPEADPTHACFFNPVQLRSFHVTVRGSVDA